MINHPPAGNRLLWLCSVLYLAFLSACSSPKNDDKLFRVLQEGIDNSTRSIIMSNSHIYASLEQKLTEYPTRERTAIWLPRAKHVRELSEEMTVYIGLLRQNIQQAQGLEKRKVEELYQKVKKYKTDLLHVDSLFAYQFGAEMTIMTPAFDSLDNGPQIFFSYFFEHATTASSLALLSRFENNVRIAENKMLAFCNEHVVTISFIDEFISAIVSQSSHFAKAGEKMEVKAGIGYLTTRNDPEIMINSKKIPLNEEGIAIYTFKASSKPGNYTMPVHINYTDENGKQQSLDTRIQYTVEDPCPDK